MYYYSQELTTDNGTTRNKKAQALKSNKTSKKAYRVFIVNNSIKNYKANGYWIDNNKLYKDKIVFKYYTEYKYAIKHAQDILNNTTEICVAIENIVINRLYIIHRNNKMECKNMKIISKYISKKEALSRTREQCYLYGGATLERIKGYYVITSYK